MAIYLKLVDVYGRENGGEVFLWPVSSIKLFITALYVVGMFRSGGFFSVLCDTGTLVVNGKGGSIMLCGTWDTGIPHFPLLKGPKLLKSNVWKIYSAFQTLCVCVILKIKYTKMQETIFICILRLFVFHFLAFYGNLGFQAYSHRNFYFALFFNI